MSNCDSARERERGRRRRKEKLRQCLRLRCQTAARLDSSELFNIYAETWLIPILCAPPTPLLPSFSPSSSSRSFYLVSPSWLGLPNIFCIELFQANLRLFALPISSSSPTSTEAALLSCCCWRCCLAASFFGFGFLSLAFAAILGLFMFCLAASC